jgi:DNA-binding CsgD family transcriptional regulator
MPTKPRANRSPRRVKGRTLQPKDLSKKEREALRLISEQGSLPLDLLAHLLSCSLSTTNTLVSKLDQAECLRSREFYWGESPWLWLRGSGERLAPCGHEQLRRPPSLHSLNHRRAVAEVRLHLERIAPRGRWTSERSLRRQREWGAQIADALFEIEGERHAIEVELSTKPKTQLRQVVAEHSRRYDAVV